MRSVIVVGSLTAGSALLLSGCLGNRHEEHSDYATGKAAKEARKSMPRWTPDDARDVRYVLSTTGDDRIIAMTVKGLPGGCAKGGPQGRPRLKADWFPQDAAARADVNCGTWSGWKDGDRLYAWQDMAVVRGKG